jgi:hypothetical protein
VKAVVVVPGHEILPHLQESGALHGFSGGGGVILPHSVHHTLEVTKTVLEDHVTAAFLVDPALSGEGVRRAAFDTSHAVVASVFVDTEAAGARNVLLRLGSAYLSFYD